MGAHLPTLSATKRREISVIQAMLIGQQRSTNGLVLKKPAIPDQRRQCFRSSVQFKASLGQPNGHGLRPLCTIDDLSTGGCSIHMDSVQPIAADLQYEVRFELPNRPFPLIFDAKLVHARTTSDGAGQKAGFRFLNPPIGLQDAIAFYLNNRQHLDNRPLAVSVPVWLEAQEGLRRFIRYRGMTCEVGEKYAICQMPQLGLATTSEVLATFIAPHFRDEIAQEAIITRVERGAAEGYRVRIEFAGRQLDDRMQLFVRQHYGRKSAKRLPV